MEVRLPENARSSSAVAGWSRSSRSELASTWATWLPSAFVLFSVFALLLAPLLLNGRIAALRQGVVLPAQEARGEINDIRHSFSQAEAAIRGLLLTGEERFLTSLRDAQADERSSFARLRPLSRRLDPSLADRVERLHERSVRANEARATLLRDALAGRADPDLLTQEEQRHEDLLVASAELRAQVVDRIETARADVRRLERISAFLTALLAALALASALVVIRSGRRFRQRGLEEAELRSAALALSEAMEVGEVLRRIAALAARMGRRDASYVERIDRDRDEVEIVAVAGEGSPPAGARVPYPGSLTEDAIRSGGPEVLEDITAAGRPISALVRAACGPCAALVLPLIADQAGQGALVILRRDRRSFSRREIPQKRVLAVLAALTLRKTVLLEQAQRQSAALEAVVESREHLIRGFSHDVKNPLGAADGHAQLLEQGVVGELSERQRDSVARIRSSVGTALELIEELIELARAEAGQLRLERREVDAVEIARELVLEYGAVADAAGLRLESDLQSPLPTVRSDPQRIRQILGNLVSNAIKYTPEGGRVRVWAELEDGRRSGDPTCWIAISVSDTGAGIALEEQHRLFREFERMEPGAAAGSGLGLAISQRIARLLGGEIRVDSEPGRGSTFTLCLPGEP